ncbi:FAD-binding oxidoreductase [Paraurantiacibacter namhicola]|uniref:Putative FAD-linked oxidoreductase n=1 Tax=Paraurantiacibacter namhicola TaxID=645517 RepID=A0A1C7D8D3_9SPHN|nr:FAD-binding oxidoreductase [Paraurantiacibacter namhicola]ANU07718.1 putative FAD-linked oxidoreductase [Paraurantiacibacter namhicola]
MNDTAFPAEARALLGPRGFTQDAELMEPWLTDWRGRYSGKAIGLASPASTQEVAAFVKLCAAHGVPIVPQGGNSGMSGGATPDGQGRSVLLSLRRMNAIRSLDADGMQATCEAGVILQTLHEAADEAGLRFPLTLGGKGSATIGGLVSTNAGGTQVLRHGTMRAQVLGIEAVLADGEIFDALAPLKKDNRGFDLKQLLIGSEGTLGIVTAATLRLLPALGGRVVMWAGMNDVRDARRLLVRAQRQCAQVLEGFEVMPRHALEAVLAHSDGARAPLSQPHEWNALIEFAADAPGANQLMSMAEDLLSQALDAGEIADATIAASEGQADGFWALRDEIAPAERAIGPAMQHDISVPVDRMADFVAETLPLVEERFPGMRAVAFGHLGDGNVHYHVLAPKGAVRGEWEASEGKAVSRFVHDLVARWGGSISAEHGIGQMKVDELARLDDPARRSMMRAVKRALDPQGLLNPGKLLPDEQALAPEGANA